jgi:hypothetical protein
MKSEEFLMLEVSFLLARYDKNSVLRAIASKMDLTESELSDALRLAASKLVPKVKARPRAAAFSMDELAEANPSKAQVLRKLHAKFENRTFLPELKDVKRFLARHNRSVTGIKSRQEAQKVLFSLIAELDGPAMEKMTIAAGDDTRDFSALGIISDEILKPKDRETE